MAPEPMMIMLSGRFSRTMASREPMMVVPFSGRLGTVRVTHPVLMRMFFPSSTCVVPSAAFTSTLPGAVMEASPVTDSTLFFLKRNPTPPARRSLTLRERPMTSLQSTLTPSTVMPNSLARLVTVR